jgi:hypothetical protein
MKELIRRILLEYLEPELLLEGKATVQVPSKINSEIDTYINKINNNGKGFTGYYYDKNYNIRRKFFNLEDTKHFRQRLFRLSEPEYQPEGDLYDPRIVNPDTLEGYNLLVENMNYISELINNGIIKPQERPSVKFYTRGPEPYSMIIIFTQNRIGSNKIDMKMITQMKGVVLSSKYTSSEPTVSVSLPLKDSSALSAIFRRLIESIKKKLGLIK